MTYPVNAHDFYHAHLYFDARTADKARALHETIGRELGLKVGRFHQALVGPHPRWSFEIDFSHQDFDLIVPWLDKHRQGLTVLVHGVTGDDLKDHTQHAYWLGEPVVLDLSAFR